LTGWRGIACRLTRRRRIEHWSAWRGGRLLPFPPPGLWDCGLQLSHAALAGRNRADRLESRGALFYWS